MYQSVASIWLETLIPRSLLLSFRFTLPFATSFLSLLRFPSIRYFLPFVSTPSFRSSFPPFDSSLPFLTVPCSFRFNSSLSLGTSFLSFQPLHPVRCCFPSFKVVHFVASFLPFQLNVCHFFPFVSTLPFRSVIPSIQLSPFKPASNLFLAARFTLLLGHHGSQLADWDSLSFNALLTWRCHKLGWIGIPLVEYYYPQGIG